MNRELSSLSAVHSLSCCRLLSPHLMMCCNLTPGCTLHGNLDPPPPQAETLLRAVVSCCEVLAALLASLESCLDASREVRLPERSRLARALTPPDTCPADDASRELMPHTPSPPPTHPHPHTLTHTPTQPHPHTLTHIPLPTRPHPHCLTHTPSPTQPHPYTLIHTPSPTLPHPHTLTHTASPTIPDPSP